MIEGGEWSRFQTCIYSLFENFEFSEQVPIQEKEYIL
jgi:hypothetical protein